MRTFKEYRAIARESLKGRWGESILVSLIYSGLISAVSWIPVAGLIAILICQGPLMFGVIKYYVAQHQKQEPLIETTFDGFQKDFKGHMITYLWVNLYIFLWTLLFIIPGLIKSYSYTMAMYLRVKNPELKGKEPMELSKQLMNGKKAKLFWLQLSFFGWALLAILTFGIGFIFLTPYMEATITAFYEDIYNEYLITSGQANIQSSDTQEYETIEEIEL